MYILLLGDWEEEGEIIPIELWRVQAQHRSLTFVAVRFSVFAIW
jgi:uncharacterized protein YuzE